MIVGKGVLTKTFTIEKKILVKHSEFFASALNSNSDWDWKESHDNSFTMEDETPKYFKVFVQFLYTGKLFVVTDVEDSEESNEDGARRTSELKYLENCWVLGETVLSTSFKDAITDALIARMKECGRFPITMHQAMYRNSGGSCGMRRLLVDVTVWKWPDYIMSSRSQHVDYMQFFFDVAVAMNQLKHKGLKGARPFSKEDTCLYHDHGDDTPCYKTMF